MLYIILLIPFIVCLILAFGFTKHVHPIEYAMVIGVSLIVTLIGWLICKHSSTSDIEYIGHYAVKIQYNEEWDEWVEETCTRTVHDGYDKDGNEITHEEEYDCSHREYHGPEWIMWDENQSDGSWWAHHISKETYDRILKRFGCKEKFIDMHRHYYRIDGDRYEAYFDGHRNHLWSFVEPNTYKNKILRSKSIFNFSEVSEEEFKENGLYDYPDFNHCYDQNPIIGYRCPQAVVDSFKYLNGYYGPKYQFRCYVMVWRNRDMNVAMLEKDYLVGGNKNELIVCMSVDNNNNIQWVNSFSWEDKPEIAIGVNYLYNQGEKLDLMKLNRYLLKNVPTKWTRKQFKDFEYIEHNLTYDEWKWILIFVIIVNICLSIFVVCNEIEW